MAKKTKTAPKAAKATKANAAIAFAKACDSFTKAYPESPVLCVLLPTGKYIAHEVSPPKAKGKGKVSGGRMSAHVIATKGCKTDKYTYERQHDSAPYAYILNGARVDNLAQAMAGLVLKSDCYTDKAMRKYYPKLMT